MKRLTNHFALFCSHDTQTWLHIFSLQDNYTTLLGLDRFFLDIQKAPFLFGPMLSQEGTGLPGGNMRSLDARYGMNYPLCHQQHNVYSLSNVNTLKLHIL